METRPPELTLLAYVECSSTASAMREALHLIELLPASTPVISCQVSPYWKIPEYQGITLSFELEHGRSAALFDDLKGLLATEWHEEPSADETVDRFAVWDYRLHGPAPLPSLRWMHLQYWQARGD